MTRDSNLLMQIGEMTEALDYVSENAKHLENTEGELLFPNDEF